MTPRPPPPGRSLAERFPAVAATWDVEENDARTPCDVAAQSSLLVHWRCPAGHTWKETVAQRVRLDQWKNGDVAACRFCTGCWVEMTFACGHMAVIASQHADAQRLCPDCWLRSE